MPKLTRAKKVIIKRVIELQSPSNPSVRLTALVTAAKYTTIKGINSTFKSQVTVPRKGIIISVPILSLA